MSVRSINRGCDTLNRYHLDNSVIHIWSLQLDEGGSTAKDKKSEDKSYFRKFRSLIPDLARNRRET